MTSRTPNDTDDLVVSLSGGSDDCRPALDDDQFANQPSRWLALLDEPDPPTAAAVIEVSQLGSQYVTLPIVEIEGSDSMAKTVSEIAGVTAIVPAMNKNSAIRRIVTGLDYLASVARLQNRGTLVAGAYGGRHTGEPPGYPILVPTDSGWDLDVDPSIDWAAAPAVIPVVNLSLGTGPANYPFLMSDIVNHATAGAARHVLVAMAAGNCGALPDQEGLSAWAEAPWVLSVGATADEAGTTLADYSSRGVQDDPASGPDIVAWGTSALSEAKHGTSFAAPRISRMAIVIAAALLQLGRAVEVASGRPKRGVPLVGYAIIDDFGSEMYFDSEPPIASTALPIIGPDETQIRQCVQLASDAGISVDVSATPDLLREIILSAAKAVPGSGPHEVGAGFVDMELVKNRLLALSGVDLLRWFGDDRPNPALDSALAPLHLFDESDLDRLVSVTLRTAPSWRYDWKTGKTGFTPIHPSESVQIDSTALEGELLEWPPRTPRGTSSTDN